MSSSPQRLSNEREVAIKTKDLVTQRFQHVITEGKHAIAIGNDTSKLLRCEDEPIHTPGAVQGFGLLVALDHHGGLLARIVSENSQSILGYTPEQLFALQSFTDILSGEHVDNFLDHLDFVRGEADVASNGPEVFGLSVCSPTQNEVKLWCAMHINDRHPHLVICEFELEDDQKNPLVSEATLQSMESTLGSDPTEEDWLASTQSASKPLRFSRSARQQPNSALAAIEVSNVISQAQEQLSAQSTVQDLLDVLVGIIQNLTQFHRSMVYRFDHDWNGQVVAELLNPEATKDLYMGLNFPAADIPEQARELYKINKVRLLYDRDQQTARFVCRSQDDLANPLDLTHSYLRAMSPIHSQYLRNMAVRSSISISITAFDELWGLISCHSYGPNGHRIPFPTRNICRILGDAASRNIERLSYISRPQLRTLLDAVPKKNPSGYITASSEELLRLFSAICGVLVIRDETKSLGDFRDTGTSQEVFITLEYLRKKSITEITASTKIENDFIDLHYPPGFRIITGLLLVPLSSRGQDFIVFFRRSQSEEVKWAGNPYEKGTEGHLTPRASFKTWKEIVTGSKEWSEEDLETAAMLCLVYGKFIEIWRQKEAALQNSQITRVLLANSAHEVRTPLNAIINYLELALEGHLDQEVRDNLKMSYSASKSLIYVINDLLDLTATVEGGALTQTEPFDVQGVLQQATGWFAKDAQRKQLNYQVTMHPDPWPQCVVLGDARRLRQAISNIIANAIENTEAGRVTVDVALTFPRAEKVEVEICVSDTGAGMNPQQIDALSNELAQVGSQHGGTLHDTTETARKALTDSANAGESSTIGLGLAVTARVVHNMRGQLRFRSEEHRGSRFILVFPFDLSKREPARQEAKTKSPVTVPDSGKESSNIQVSETTTPLDVDENPTLAGASGDSSEALGTFSIDGDPAFSTGSKATATLPTEATQEPSRAEGLSISPDGNGTPATKEMLNKGQAIHDVEVVESGGLLNPPLQESNNLRPQSGTVNIPRPGRSSETLHGEDGSQSPVVDTSDAQAVPRDEKGAHSNNDKHPLTSSTESAPRDIKSDSGRFDNPSQTDIMRVLVAEDDPVNSRIINKRLSKLGHKVHLTSNGEECAYAYREEEGGRFDIILMDIQVRPKFLTSGVAHPDLY